MISKDLIKTIIIDSQRRTVPIIWKRALEIPTHTDKIITLSGVRRSGKTYHLFQLMNTLKKSGISPERIIYINFEDERLTIKGEDLDILLQAYQELYPHIALSSCYFFFDEIQEIQGWEKFIARVYSSISRNIFITGSNAKLLSKEIATALRGRTVTFEIYPLSFYEYCQIVSPNLNIHASSDKAKILAIFNQFLSTGGFPEVINHSELKEKILQEYFDVMVLKDIIERYQISNSSILKYFCKRIISSSAGEFSVNKIYNELKSQGYKISKDSLYNYQEYVENIYLNRFLRKFSFSVVKTETSQKKTYVIDQGLGASLDFKLSQDKGRILETTIALELLKQEKQIAYYRNTSECDFLVIEKGAVTQAIQVTTEVTEENTRKREIKGLIDACGVHNLTRGIILTHNHKEDLHQEGIDISFIPTWEYFLSSST